MAAWFKRASALLALLSVISFALHLEPGHNLQPENGHHCCLCHTAGIATVAPVEAFSPPTQLSESLPYYGELPQESPFPLPDASRGPPAA